MAVLDAPVESQGRPPEASVRGLPNQNTYEQIQQLAQVILLEPDNPLWPSEIPTYATEVDGEAKFRKFEVIDNVSVCHEQVTMTDGNGYHTADVEPLRRLTDIKLAMGTPLGTQVEGFNLDVAIMLARRTGFPVKLIGPETGVSIPLSHSAHNFHKILDKDDEKGFSEPKKAVLEGYSRWAMGGFGVVATAAQHDRQIIYANLTDPCIANPVKFEIETAIKALREAPVDIMADALSSIVQIGNLALHPRRAHHYAKTVDLSIDGVRQFVHNLRPLVTGEAGYLASQMPPEAQVLVAFFKRTPFNHRVVYEGILNPLDHPGVEVRHVPGGHIKGLDKRIMGHIAARFSGISRQLAEGRNTNELDWTLVHKNHKAA